MKSHLKGSSEAPFEAPSEAAYYVPGGPAEAGGERFLATSDTAGPWSARAQHGGPPAALLGRSIEALAPAGHVVGSFAMDILGPIPVAPLRVSTSVVRPGRSVSLLVAELHDDRAAGGAGRAVARAKAWTFPASADGPGVSEPPHSHPDHGRVFRTPEGWGPGYLDSIEWRWVTGTLGSAGPAVAWMRPTVPLVPGEEMSGLQRLLTCVDSASGVSSALDIRAWAFMNTELTVTVLRQPVGEWICLDAETTLGPGSVGVAVSAAYDERGLVARSSQTLLVTPR